MVGSQEQQKCSSSTQTERCSVCGTHDVIAFLLCRSPAERQRMFSTSKREMQAALREGSQPDCSRCSFTSYVYSLFDQSWNKSSLHPGWTLIPGQLMTLLCPPQLVNLLQFVWNGGDRIQLGDTLIREDRLLLTFLQESLHVMSQGTEETDVGVDIGIDIDDHMGFGLARGNTLAKGCNHQCDAPKHAELDCSLRRLNDQEAQIARLEMFCDEILDCNSSQEGEEGDAREDREQQEEGNERNSASPLNLDVENFLNENSSHVELEQRVREFERDLETYYKSKGALKIISKQIQGISKHIQARKQRLQTACCHGIRNGSKAVMRALLQLCWRRAFSEFYAMKALSMRELDPQLGDSDFKSNEWNGIKSQSLNVMNMSAQQLKHLLDSQEILNSRLHQEETKCMGQKVELETLQSEVDQLTKELEEINPKESTLNAMSLKELEEVIEALDAKVTRLQMRKAALVVEQSNKCCVCWTAKKEVAFKCGHQTCASCSEQIHLCPICRQTIDLRIKLF